MKTFFIVTLVSCFCLFVSVTTASEEPHLPVFTEPLATEDTVRQVADAAPMEVEVEPITEAWKDWHTVENHTFGKNRGNLPMIADLRSLHPFFRDRVLLLIQRCKAKGIELAVVESFRTHAKQSEYYSMGKKYTRTTGGKSKHQYGLAVDLVPVVDSVAVWDNVVLWRKIGVEGERLGMRWGGRWRSPYDPAHFEWTGGLTTYQLANGALPVIPKTFSSNYPCLEDDIAELRKYWDAWEEEQLAIRRKRLNRSLATRRNP